MGFWKPDLPFYGVIFCQVVATHGVGSETLLKCLKLEDQTPTGPASSAPPPGHATSWCICIILGTLRHAVL